ncbi:hypothetical protein LIER_21029 [Lithospermum erythrorhizon]|uniref:Polyprotein n=1 Tax=Lithospermum erythrorhizon TaxID=34254 RepID=A0AAV3QNS1_LITER
MVDDKPIMDQVHVFENLCIDVVNEVMKPDDIFLANVLLEKFPSTWNEYRNRFKHKKQDMPLQELISHMRTEEVNRLKDKLDSVVQILANANLVETGGPSNVNRFKGKAKVDQKKWQSKKPNQSKFTKPDAKIQKNVTLLCYVLDTGASRHLCANKEMFQNFVEVTDGECVYMGYAQNAVAYRFLSLSDHSISEGRDAEFF